MPTCRVLRRPQQQSVSIDNGLRREARSPALAKRTSAVPAAFRHSWLGLAHRSIEQHGQRRQDKSFGERHRRSAEALRLLLRPQAPAVGPPHHSAACRRPSAAPPASCPCPATACTEPNYCAAALRAGGGPRPGGPARLGKQAAGAGGWGSGGFGGAVSSAAAPAWRASLVGPQQCPAVRRPSSVDGGATPCGCRAAPLGAGGPPRRRGRRAPQGHLRLPRARGAHERRPGQAAAQVGWLGPRAGQQAASDARCRRTPRRACACTI